MRGLWLIRWMSCTIQVSIISWSITLKHCLAWLWIHRPTGNLSTRDKLHKRNWLKCLAGSNRRVAQCLVYPHSSCSEGRWFSVWTTERWMKCLALMLIPCTRSTSSWTGYALLVFFTMLHLTKGNWQIPLFAKSKKTCLFHAVRVVLIHHTSVQLIWTITF